MSLSSLPSSTSSAPSPSISSSSSSSSIPYKPLYAEWTFDKEPVETAIFGVLKTIIVIPTDPSDKEDPTAKIAATVTNYLQDKRGVFGEEEWTRFCGKVPPAPALPEDMEHIWNSLCPVSEERGMRIKDKQICFYLPPTVDGKPLNFKIFGEIVKRYFPTNKDGYRVFGHHPCLSEYMGESITKPRWMLMTKDLLSESRGNSFDFQQTMIARRTATTGTPYKVPRALEIVVGIMTHYFSSGERLLSSEEGVQALTRCQEGYRLNLGTGNYQEKREYHMLVGCFFTNGIAVIDDDYPSRERGIVAVRSI